MLESIKTKAEYDIALERVYKLMQENIAPNSKESEELENLSILNYLYVKLHKRNKRNKKN